MSEDFGPTEDELASQRSRRPPHCDPVPLAIPRRVPDHRALSGERTRLEPPDPDRHDMTSLWRATHGSVDRTATWRFMGYGPFATPEDFSAWFAGCAADADLLWFVAIDHETLEPIGMAAIMRPVPEHAAIEVGNIWFVPTVRGTPRTTETIFLLMNHAFTAGYRRLEWKCDAANLTSRRAALRLGFRFEGIFVNHMIVKGRNRDTAWFSITDQEWPAVRHAIEAWLDPSNFAADGVATTSLRSSTQQLW